jgi:hypothetical protein
VGQVLATERRHVQANYTTLPFRSKTCRTRRLRLQLRWNPRAGAGLREQLVATTRYRKAEAATRCRCCAPRSQPLWPAAGEQLQVRMPIVLRAGRLRAAG